MRLSKSLNFLVCILGVFFFAATAAADCSCPFTPTGNNKESQEYYCQGYIDGCSAAEPPSVTGSTTQEFPLNVIRFTPRSSTSSETPEEMLSIFVPGNWREKQAIGDADWALIARQSQISSPRAIIPMGSEGEEVGWALVEPSKASDWSESENHNFDLEKEIELLLSNVPENEAGYTLLIPNNSSVQESPAE